MNFSHAMLWEQKYFGALWTYISHFRGAAVKCPMPAVQEPQASAALRHMTCSSSLAMSMVLTALANSSLGVILVLENLQYPNSSNFHLSIRHYVVRGPEMTPYDGE